MGSVCASARDDTDDIKRSTMSWLEDARVTRAKRVNLYNHKIRADEIEDTTEFQHVTRYE